MSQESVRPANTSPIEATETAAPEKGAAGASGPKTETPETDTPETEISKTEAPSADASATDVCDTESSDIESSDIEASDTESSDTAAPPVADQAIPALEPPAPLSSRFAAPKRAGRWMRDRLQETPCWLTSLAAHLAVVLLLGSFIIPERMSANSLDLLVLFAELDSQEEEGRLVVVQTAPVESESLKQQGEQGDVSENAESKEAPIEETPPAPDEEDPAPIADEIEESKPEDASFDSTKEFDLGVEIPTNLMSVFAPSREDRVDSGRARRALRVPPGLDVRDERDEIVDRFIEYDVGRLRGEEGMRANNRFKALGPDAIPALVRGLNKSAGIRASCPIVVIGQRLENQLRRTSDPIMIQYALDHLGDGVHKNAPHRNRIDNLRKRLEAYFLKVEDQIEKTAEEYGVPLTNDLLEQVKESASLTDSQLRAAISSDDIKEQVAGMMAASLRERSIGEAPRFQLAQALIAQMESETDPRMVAVQHRTLTKLGERYFPVPRISPSPSLTANEWLRQWDAVRQSWRNRDAKVLLATAKRRLSERKSVAASQILRKVVKTYPETAVAEEAQIALGSLDFSHIAAAQYNRGMSLENARKGPAALRLYEDLMIKYPDTRAAKEASRRVAELRRTMPRSDGHMSQ